MDRRVLALVALAAAGMAILLGWWMRPDVGPPPQAPVVAAPRDAPARAAVRPQARVAAPPKTLGTPEAPTATSRTAAERAAEGMVGGRGPAPPTASQLQGATPEYRCRALGQQSQLIDQLMVVGRGTAVDEEQKRIMVGRVATMALRVFEEGESLWAGELDCEGISEVNLGPAADWLAQMRDELELDENGQIEVEQALGVLDSVDWPDPEGG